MEHGEVIIRRIDDVPWADAETVFGTRGDPARCWCQYFKLKSTEWSELGGAACAVRLHTQVSDAREHGSATPGLVAYVAGEPVGWVAVEPRPHYPTVLRGKVAATSAEAADDLSVWSVVCFVVRVGHRRSGIAGALLDGAVAHARAGGARVVEGYPVDTDEKPGASSAELYHGTLRLFERAGFRVTARPLSGRALVTLTL